MASYPYLVRCDECKERYRVVKKSRRVSNNPIDAIVGAILGYLERKIKALVAKLLPNRKRRHV
jgi:hypothetical protein